MPSSSNPIRVRSASLVPNPFANLDQRFRERRNRRHLRIFFIPLGALWNRILLPSLWPS